MSPRVAPADEGTSRCVPVGAGVLAVVDAGVDPAVLPPPVPTATAGVPVADADAEVDADVVGAAPKTNPEPIAEVVVVVVRDGDPNEKPTLPALGGVDPSLLTGATPNPNGAGDADDTAPPKVNGDCFTGVPNGPPNMLLGGGRSGSAWSFSLSSVDFVAAPNMLLGAPEELVASGNNFVPGAMLKEKGDDPNEVCLSFSLSFSSGAALSEPNIEEVFELPKSKVLVGPVAPPPKGEALEEVVPVGANAPSEKAGFSGGRDSAPFDAAELNWDDEDAAPVKLEKGEDDAADADLGSEDVADEDENLKGDGSVVGGAGLGVKPAAGAAEVVGAAKPAKLVGGNGIAAGPDVAGLRKEDGAAGMEGLLGGLEALWVFT